jgi:Flp pilus assembly protein TadD
MFSLSMPRSACIAALALAAACASPLAWADDYGEIQRLLKAGQNEAAVTKARSLSQAKPKDPQLRFLLASAQTAAGQVDAAIDTLRALIADYPELAEPHNNLAVIYASRGEYGLARTELETAIGLNPGYATALENLGDLYARMASQQYALSARAGGNGARLSAKQRDLAQVLGTAQASPQADGAAPKASAASAGGSTGKRQR